MRDEDYYKLKDEDYKLWDLRTEVTYNDAACILLDLNPAKCLAYQHHKYPDSSVFIDNLPAGIQAKIKSMRDVLEDVRKRGELQETTPTGPNAWMAMPFTRKISLSSLKTWAERKDLRSMSIFPEERGKQTHQTIAEHFANNPPKEADTLKQFQPPKKRRKEADWRIRDFTEWDLKDEFGIDEVAYLYCEADPKERWKEPLQQGIIPDDVWQQIKDMRHNLLTAAGNKTLYRPENRDKYAPFKWCCPSIFYENQNNDPSSLPEIHIISGGIFHVQRDDLKYFFAERLGEKPKFLFREMRKTKQKEKKINYTSPISSESLNKKMNVQEAATHYRKSEDTIRRWVEEGRLLAEKDPGGRILKIIGLNLNFKRISAAVVKRTSRKK